ncbi:MAG: methyltransferase domain-containing protein [Terriglobales bacterium]
MSVYRCPECLAQLRDAGGSLRCTQCSLEYPVADGVPLLTRNRDYYYGHEVPRDVMRSILARATEVGWKKALTEHADESGDMGFYGYSASEARAGFKFLLDHFEQGVVLDYGCGSGANTLSLARNFSHVYATDLTAERAQFTRIRAQQENLSNVTVFCCGDTEHIPLPDHSVDVVIVDGVLEWVPESRPGEPSRVQVDFLKELSRVLKQDGHLFITIENRYGAGYFAGIREEHTRMRFVSLLPRRVGDLYSQWLRGRPVRTYTYSRSGYRALLEAAGLGVADFWGLLPTYRLMEKALALDDQRMIDEALTEVTWKKRLRNLFVRPILPWVVGSFGIVAGRVRSTPYVKDLTRHVAKTYLNGDELKILRYWRTPAGVVQVHAATARERYILDLPLHPSAERRLEASVANIQQLESIEGVSLKQLRVPRPIAWACYRGQAFLLEPELSGRSLNDQISGAAFDELLPRASEYLVTLCKTTLQPAGSWPEILGQKIREYGLPLAEQYRQRGLPGDIEKDILQMADSVKKAASPGEGFFCCIHGDFRPGNLLVSGDRGSAITAVLNWGFFEMQSLPFLDLFEFMTTRGRQSSWGDRVVKLLHALRSESADTSVVRDYARQVNVDASLIPHFLMVYWIRQCLRRLQADVPQLAKVLEEGIRKPLDSFRVA